MIHIDRIEVKEASRVYGDMIEKQAFNVSIDPVTIAGALAGGYAANRVQGKVQDAHQKAEVERLRKERSLESGYYSQIQNILTNLKIIFTPINVVYSVNGQVFEIISTDEMNPDMKAAFLKKDAYYYRDLLLNKMNMEIQLAEQAFAQRLLAQNAQMKQASYLDRQEYLTKLAWDEFIVYQNHADQGLDKIASIQIPVNFDSIRPFKQAECLTKPGVIQKVAGFLDYFQRDNDEVLELNRLKKELNVSFLPDRVIFLHNGQLLEQISLLQMNEEGYEAFRRRDKQFFLNTFVQEAKKISHHVTTDVTTNVTNETFEQEATTEEYDFSKEAASLEEVLEASDDPMVIEREEVSLFEDYDIHPLMYITILQDKFGVDWYTNELEALFKQIEVNFNLENKLSDAAINKISLLMAVLDDNHTVFQSSFTFEKFIRAMNDKSVSFTSFESNIEFEELMFGLDIAKSVCGDHVFEEFHEQLAQYAANECFRDGIRFISNQIYDEKNPSENFFFESLNGYLMRLWKENDSRGMLEPSSISEARLHTELIRDRAEEILQKDADRISLENPYESISFLVDKQDPTLANPVIRNVARHVSVGLYLEYKRQELEYLMSHWK